MYYKGDFARGSERDALMSVNLCHIRRCSGTPNSDNNAGAIPNSYIYTGKERLIVVKFKCVKMI